MSFDKNLYLYMRITPLSRVQDMYCTVAILSGHLRQGSKLTKFHFYDVVCLNTKFMNSCRGVVSFHFLYTEDRDIIHEMRDQSVIAECLISRLDPGVGVPTASFLAKIMKELLIINRQLLVIHCLAKSS